MSAISLTTLVRELQLRYPKVTVRSADRARRQMDDGDEILQQEIVIEGPLEHLVEGGLVTEKMIENARGDDRRGARWTPIGDGFCLQFFRPGPIDSQAPCRLLLWTGERPRERERFSVREAARELKRIMRTR